MFFSNSKKEHRCVAVIFLTLRDMFQQKKNVSMSICCSRQVRNQGEATEINIFISVSRQMHIMCVCVCVSPLVSFM